ncbi:MAG: hypothetical protein A2846_03225 [Candidatus Doudnabacteria bacterium RIFCSPHIGHO2_01_FULL_49_9]|uniref:Methyltransferase type 11 domain-containing protein n=1 Tax=Candidatus Doudnabacteria bacterium RIFCSPHIGHO2_01_FULL_49_9 TaxID=1817827 RepID=A0A1F5NYC6_9BACT|nr:MAG: hypothetical protein A2846_03225 [Candidatus Doudnabacteria bacterium RIFCSPHIGHO2_01_FULL_49_9]
MIKFLHHILTSPQVSIVLRKIVENNFKKEKAVIRKYFSAGPGERVLDLGCGTGEFSGLFPAKNYLGIDIDPKNIAYSQKHHQGEFQVADARRLLFANESFDKVLVVGVLHHLSAPDCRLVLKEIKRVLGQSGRVLVMEDTRSRRLTVRYMQSVDQGAFIREFSEWETLVSEEFIIQKSGTFDSGACFYSYFLASKASP